MPREPGSSIRWIYYFLILLSGAAGLVYEVVWARQLTLFIGNTAVANAAVLTAFMLGLALGSLILGRWADKIARPLRFYALIESLIGAYGLTTPWLFDFLQLAYANFAGVVGVSGAYSHLPRFLVAIVAMLIPTFLMGGTLPLLVKHFALRLSQAHSVTSRIYGINTIGATIGAFCAGFLLLPAMGITDTLLLAAAVNILVGLGVYGLLASSGLQQQDKKPESEVKEEPEAITHSSLLLVGFGLSGFAALLYQVVWIHSLVLVIGVSIYAFSTVLTVFLGGVGLGSLLFGRFIRFTSARRALKMAFCLQMGIALSALASLSLISQLPILFVEGWARYHESFTIFQTYTFMLAGIVMLVPTFLLGGLFPLITALWSNRKGAVGRGVGDAYGANALGTISGSAIGGLFLLDWLGIEGSLYLASGISMLVAALFWYLSSPDRSFLYRWLQIPLAALMLVGLILILPGWDRTLLQAQVFRHPYRYLSGNIRAQIEAYMSRIKFLYYKEGIHGTISVISWPDERGIIRKTLLNNGKADAGTSGDMRTQILLGQLPMFLHEAPKEIMVIGLGSGITAGSVLQNTTVENLDILEISPEVVEASFYFKEDNYEVLSNPRTNMIVADARNYLLASRKKYDIIISQPSHSWATGASNLFTFEFLQQASNRLNENGILVQWYHMYGVDRNSLKALLKSVSDVFPHYTLWIPSSGDIIIVTSNEPLELDYQKKSKIFESPKFRSDLERIGIFSVEWLMNYLLMSSNETQQLLMGQKANTDEYPIVEFNAPKYIYKSTIDDNISMLTEGLQEGIYALPFVNLVNEYKDWIEVPFLGVSLNHGGKEYSAPNWNLTRKLIYDELSKSYRPSGGMSGDIAFKKPWGDVLVSSTIGKKRGTTNEQLLFSMLQDRVPKSEATVRGKLIVPVGEAYWRVGPSSQPDRLNVVLARRCERKSGLHNWVSIFTNYPGNASNTEDARLAMLEVNKLFRCLDE